MLTKNSHKNGVDVPYGNSVLLDSSENAPESRRLGKAFRLGAYGPPLEKYVFAATPVSYTHLTLPTIYSV